jgi:uncharacterized protein (TIGR02284 family)
VPTEGTEERIMAIGQSYETKANEKIIDTLNSYLRGELSAVETYRQALVKIEDEFLRASLHELSQSHQHRVSVLRSRIAQLGGDAAQSSGMWGGFAKLVEGGAKTFGIKAALAALEEGEDHGMRMYRDDTDDLDASLQALVLNELLPEQQRSHDQMSNLKHSFH